MFGTIYFQIWLGLHIVVMITGIDFSQEIYAIDILKALLVESSLTHGRKYVLQRL